MEKKLKAINADKKQGRKTIRKTNKAHPLTPGFRGGRGHGGRGSRSAFAIV